MATRLVSLSVVLGLLLATNAPLEAEEWLVIWQGQDLPGPTDLPFTTGWPADNVGFEQYSPNPCYDEPPGPNLAEATNLDTAGWLTIQNLLDGTCIGVGHPSSPGSTCDTTYNLYTIKADPCGMQYQVGPRTIKDFYHPYNSELMAYHGGDFVSTYTNGVTAEASFYIASCPTQWTKLIDIEAYPKYNNPWNTGGGDYSDNHACKVQVRHFVSGHDNNDWFLTAEADNTFILGAVKYHDGSPGELLNRWITVRLALSEVPGKPQMTVWLDGILHHEGGWDALNQGQDNGNKPHGFCRFGWNHADGGDIRIGTMAFTNKGTFSPNPRGQCRDYFGDKYLRPLAPVARTRANPEVCDNGIDDDGDGLTDCDDPECFQNGACENLLVNGSFEQVISPCDPTDCAMLDTRPGGWESTGSGTVVAHGDQWLPVPPATDGYTRGSISSSGGGSTAYQTVRVVAGTAVTLQGDIATGHSDGQSFEHFVELGDGNQDSLTLIGSFVETASTTALLPFTTLSGICQSGEVTVRWGYRSTGGGGPVTTHVDNLYLTGTPRGRCNDPFADADGDGDVDQVDFAIWQLCQTGDGGGPIAPLCECFDVQGANGLPDDDIDQGDLTAFEACASGPAVLADPSCDDDVVRPPFDILAAGSRKQHGTVGPFDVDLLSPSAVEPRNGGPTKIVVTFEQDVQAADGSLDIGDEVTASGASISQVTLLCDELTIDLTGVANQSCVSIILHGLALASDPTMVMPDRQLKVVALFGDVTGDGVVSGADVDAINGGIAPTVTSSTFRRDLDFDGDIDNIDAMLAQFSIPHAASCP